MSQKLRSYAVQSIKLLNYSFLNVKFIFSNSTLANVLWLVLWKNMILVFFIEAVNSIRVDVLFLNA